MVQEPPRGATQVQGQWRLGGDTPRPRSGAAGRSHLALEAKGGDPEEPPEPEARGGSREEHLEEPWLHTHREGLEELFHVQGQEGQQ